MGRYSYNGWPPYVTVAERRRKAAKKVAKMKKSGHNVSPVEITGNKIARTFWGNAWCKNLESYSDYSNRLPRGRAYVRNGSVVDLQIETGCVRALVSGTDLYKVEIKIKPLTKKGWKEIKGRCVDQIGTLVELLQGSISKGVMEIVTRKDNGLFPSPREIKLSCSCPDWAIMCKHVAATLYGTGARLDHEPELFFTLRGVDPTEMVEAAVDKPQTEAKARKARVLETDELSSVFGIDIDMDGLSSDKKQVLTKPAKKMRRTAAAGRKAASNEPKKKKIRARPAIGKAAVAKPATAKSTSRSSSKATPKSTVKKTTGKKSVSTKATTRKAKK